MRLQKVNNKRDKEESRNGTKYRNRAISTQFNKDIEKYLNKVIIGDSETVLKLLPDDSVDMIITSPPYNFGLSYENDPDKDSKRWEDYFAKLGTIWAECYRILKPGGRIAVNIQPLYSDYIPTHHIISNQLLKLGMLWKAEVLWEKNNYNAKYTAWGSWKSPSMPYLKYTWEFIEVFSKETHKKIGNKDNVDITGDEFKKWVYGKWSIAPEKKMNDYDHPAMFPEELPNRLIKLFSYQNDIILDPFNGVGTTTLVAHKLRRNFIGIDISKDYCETAAERILNDIEQNLLLNNDHLEIHPHIIIDDI